jgi:hypothetical protein
MLRTLFSALSAAVFLTAPAWTPAASAQAKDTPFGVLLTPAHMPAPRDGDLLQSLQETAFVGGHVSFMWEWADDTAFENISALMPLYRAFGLKTFIQMSPTGVGRPAPPENLPASFADPDVRSRYLTDLQRLAALQPDYMNLAAEINLLHHVDGEVGTSEWSEYVTLYQEAYQQVKAISPGTQVGVSFHLDLLFGYEQYALIEELGEQDYVGFTTYPSWLVYKGVFSSVDDIPVEYYDRVRIVVPDKPIVYAEVGWPSAGTGTYATQADYVAALPRLLHGTTPVLTTWSMLHDVDHFRVEALSEEQIAVLRGFDLDPVVLFAELNSMGLLFWDGPPKPAWLAAIELTFGF